MNRNKVQAMVTYVLYADFDREIEAALAAPRGVQSVLVVHTDCNTTAMRACGLIGKRFNQKAIDIENGMRRSFLVDFKEHGTKKEWKSIVQRYKLSTASRFIDDKQRSW